MIIYNHRNTNRTRKEKEVMKREETEWKVRIVIEASEEGDETLISTDDIDDRLATILDDFETEDNSWESNGIYEVSAKITGMIISEESADRFEPDYYRESRDVDEDDIKNALKDMPVSVYMYED